MTKPFLLSAALLAVTIGALHAQTMTTVESLDPFTGQPAGISWVVSHTGTLSHGHYLDGSPWIVVPTGQSSLTIQSVSPATTGTGIGLRNGSMLNVLGPTHLSVGNRHQSGYDGRIDPSRFNSLLAALYPLPMEPGDSLVSTISQVDPPSPLPCDGSAQRPYPTFVQCMTTGSRVKQAAVLTCLRQSPPLDAFRPAYAGYPTRPTTGSNPAWNRVGLESGVDASGPFVERHYRLSNVSLISLRRLSVPPFNPGERPSIEDPAWNSHRGLKQWFARVWLDHAGTEWNEDEINPSEHMVGYGLPQAAAISMAAVALLEGANGFTDAEKLPLLKGFLQVGIDSYGVVRREQTYEANPTALARTGHVGSGGKNGGRLFPILFAGHCFNDDGLKHPPRWVSINPVEFAFKEDFQFFARPDDVRDWQGSRFWWKNGATLTDYQRFSPLLDLMPQPPIPIPLSAACVTQPQGGCICSHPTWQRWSLPDARAEQYRFSSSRGMVGVALAARALGFFDLLNHDLQGIRGENGILGYIERFMVPMNGAAPILGAGGQPNQPGTGAIGHYSSLKMDDPCIWFNSHLDNGEQVHGSPSSVTSYSDREYLKEMWHLHRWSANRTGVSVSPPDFRVGMPAQGAPNDTRPVLVCHQAVASATPMEFEVYGLRPNSLMAFYLGGLSMPGFAFEQILGPCNSVDTAINMGTVVLVQPEVVNAFGYASFSLPLPAQPPSGLTWGIQVLSYGDDCPAGTAPLSYWPLKYAVVSNAWRFEW